MGQGGGSRRAGGAGGGAIELIAHGNGALTLATGSKVSVNGGDTKNENEGGGGGSGGSIRLVGGTIENHGQLDARGGGLGATGEAEWDGAGGRIAFDSNGSVLLGSYDLSGHSTGTTWSYYPHLDGTLALRGDSGRRDLAYSTGTLTIDTSVGYWIHSDGEHGIGLIESHDDNGTAYKTCSFTFDSINLTGTLGVILQGDNSLILKTRSNGNITIGVDLDASGGDSTYLASRSPDNYQYHAAQGRLGGRKYTRTDFTDLEDGYAIGGGELSG